MTVLGLQVSVQVEADKMDIIRQHTYHHSAY